MKTLCMLLTVVALCTAASGCGRFRERRMERLHPEPYCCDPCQTPCCETGGGMMIGPQ